MCAFQRSLRVRLSPEPSELRRSRDPAAVLPLDGYLSPFELVSANRSLTEPVNVRTVSEPLRHAVEDNHSVYIEL